MLLGKLIPIALLHILAVSDCHAAPTYGKEGMAAPELLPLKNENETQGIQYNMKQTREGSEARQLRRRAKLSREEAVPRVQERLQNPEKFSELQRTVAQHWMYVLNNHHPKSEERDPSFEAGAEVTRFIFGDPKGDRAWDKLVQEVGHPKEL